MIKKQIALIKQLKIEQLKNKFSWLIQQIMDCTANQDMQVLVRSAWIVVIVVAIYKNRAGKPSVLTVG